MAYAPAQEVAIKIQDATNPSKWHRLNRWNQYTITHDIMEPTIQFSVDFAGTAAQRAVVAPTGGQRVEIYYDGALQCIGITDERSNDTSTTATTNDISGRGTAGLLVDSIIEPFSKLSIRGLNIERVANRWLDPWMPNEVASIALNGAAARYVSVGGIIGARRGYGVTINGVFRHIKARPGRPQRGKFGRRSPVYAGTNTDTITGRFDPGTKVWDGLASLAEQIGCHVWQTVDSTVVLDRPDYQFDPSAYGVGLRLLWDRKTGKATGGNVTACTFETSIAERSSTYHVLAAAKSSRTVKGKNLQHYRQIRDPSPAFWNRDSRGKITTAKLYKPGEIEAKNLTSPTFVFRKARRQMTERALKGLNMEYLIAGHYAPTGVLWVPDTMVQLLDERNELDGQYYIQRVERRFTGSEGRVTLLRLIPPDVWLGKFDDDSVTPQDFEVEIAKRIWW